MKLTKISVSLRNDLDRKTYSEAEIVSLSQAGKVGRAVKVLILCWLVAAVCVLIPGFHFILVPAGLLVGVVLFFRQLKLHQLFVKGNITCPSCQNTFPAKSTSFNWPRYDRCSGCRAELVMQKYDANDNVRK